MTRKDFNSSQYDYNEIYSGSSKDEKGQSTNLRCKIPDAWAAQISRIVYSPDWPEYETPQSFIRDAIYHRLHWVNEQREIGRTHIDTRVRQLMEVHQMQEDLLIMETMRSQFHDLQKTMEVRFTDLMADGDHAALTATVANFESRAGLFSEPYQSMLRRELRRWENRVGSR